VAGGRQVRPRRQSRRSRSAGSFLPQAGFQKNPSAGLCDIAQNTGYLFNGFADILGVRDGSLLAVDGGGTSLTSRLRFVDLSGLAERRIAGFWQRDDMAGLRNYIFDEVKPTFIKIFSGWAERDRLDLVGDPRLEQDYVMLLSGPPRGGRWVRRDSARDGLALDEARRWGQRVWNQVILAHSEVVPTVVVVRRSSAAQSISRGLASPVPVDAAAVSRPHIDRVEQRFRWSEWRR